MTAAMTNSPERPLRIYVAGSYTNKALLREFGDSLKRAITAKGDIHHIKITSTWLTTPPEMDPVYRCRQDFDDIDHSDMLVTVAPGGEGTSGEVGYALGKGIPVFCMSYDDGEELVFPAYHHKVHRCYYMNDLAHAVSRKFWSQYEAANGDSKKAT